MAFQKVGKKKLKKISKIIGLTVNSAVANGADFPNFVVLAWTAKNCAYLVNMKKKVARPYVHEGKFVMKRVRLPIRVKLRPKNDDAAGVLDAMRVEAEREADFTDANNQPHPLYDQMMEAMGRQLKCQVNEERENREWESIT